MKGNNYVLLILLLIMSACQQPSEPNVTFIVNPPPIKVEVWRTTGEFGTGWNIEHLAVQDSLPLVILLYEAGELNQQRKIRVIIPHGYGKIVRLEFKVKFTDKRYDLRILGYAKATGGGTGTFLGINEIVAEGSQATNTDYIEVYPYEYNTGEPINGSIIIEKLILYIGSD
jgi:hypothetical protein